MSSTASGVAPRSLGGLATCSLRELDALYRAAHGLDHGARRPVPLINASLNVFGYDGAAWRLEVWGDISHLAADQVTVYRGASA